MKAKPLAVLPGRRMSRVLAKFSVEPGPTAMGRLSAFVHWLGERVTDHAVRVALPVDEPSALPIASSWLPAPVALILPVLAMVMFWPVTRMPWAFSPVVMILPLLVTLLPSPLMEMP